MPDPTRLDEEVSERALEILEEVTLHHFTADPTGILPFGSSTLSWRVDGPAGFHVKLNVTTVARIGTRVVQPTESVTYRLYAHAGPHSKFLGLVAVTVNLAQCRSAENGFVVQLLGNALQEGIDARNDIYFRAVSRRNALGRVTFVPSVPEVSIAPDRVRFILKLGGRVDWFPDPDIDVDARFGLTVSSDFPVGRSIVPTNEDIKVKASLPFYAWLIPGAAVALPIVLGNAEDETRAGMRDAIRSFVSQGIDGYFNALPVLAGLEAHSVRIHTGGPDGIVEATFCPTTAPPIVIE